MLFLVGPRAAAAVLLAAAVGLASCASSPPPRLQEPTGDPNPAEIRVVAPPPLSGGDLTEILALPSTPAPAVQVTPSPSTAVILVVVDGVRWQDVFQGPDEALARRQWMLGKLPRPAELLPTIHTRFFAGGAVLGGKGAPFVASGPVFVSLPGYLEIMTGHSRSGCTTNLCEAVSEPTLADEVRGLPDVKQDDVAVISSWEVIDRAAALDPSRIVVSAGRHGGATRARTRVSDAAKQAFDEGELSVPFPGGFDYRPDRYTAPLALAYLAERAPRFLFVGLGDPDEYGHGNDYPRYLESLQAADRFLRALFQTLEGMGEYGKGATVIVTSDHGRAKDFRNHGKAPESARTFLLAAGAGIPARGSVSLPQPRRLADIAPTIRVLLGLPPSEREGQGAPLGLVLQAPLDRGPFASAR